MKRFRQGEGGEMDSINIAGVLMLLSRGPDEADNDGTMTSAVVRSSTSPSRVFECKTCNRQFPSFQALGGHRASHKKPRAVTEGGGGAHGSGGRDEKPRVHECSICGLEFAIGQALGGHMRRHRADQTGGGGGGEKKKVWLDLNLPPTTLDIVDPIPMLDCFY